MLVHNVEQRSPEWYALRAGMPTASEFSKLVTSTGEPSKSLSGYALTLAAELYAGKSIDAWEGNGWTDRGSELEPQAISLYEFANDVTITKTGFVTRNDNSAGCSPDGLVGDDGMVEFKCLKAENHVKAILYFQKHGHCQPDYIQQTQGQILIAERAWCDLVFYHPELPPLIIRQLGDKVLFDAIDKGIKSVRMERDKVLAALIKQSRPETEAS